MNTRAIRAFFIAALAANVLLVSLMLLDYFYANSRFFSAILVSFGVLVIITAVLMIFFVGDDLREPAAAAADPAPVPRAAALPMVQPMVVTGVSSWEEPDGPFTYQGYTLYSKDVRLKGGKSRTIYFFSKKTPKSGKAIAKPMGYHVGVNEESGLPFLKKGKGADGEDLTPEHEHALRPQCSALTEDGQQCRNSARGGSKYCASHFGYQPPAIAAAEAKRRDTLARVPNAPDTLPSVRKH